MSTYLAYVLVAFLALIDLTSANFDVYQVIVKSDHNAFGWHYMNRYMIFNNVPRCNTVGRGQVFYQVRDDLSHGRHGFRCVGKCHNEDPPWPGIQIMEMHFSNDPEYHFTIYKDRAYQDGNTWLWPMYGTDGKKHGSCFAYGNHYFDKCDWSHDGDTRVASGWRKFRCLTDLDADRLTAATQNEVGLLFALGSDGDKDEEDAPQDNSTMAA